MEQPEQTSAYWEHLKKVGELLEKVPDPIDLILSLEKRVAYLEKNLNNDRVESK